jgi:membrane-bound lytic murein transglycosylase B
MGRPLATQHEQPGERRFVGVLARRLTVLAVLAPLTVIASSGLMRATPSSPVERVALGAAPAEAAPTSAPSTTPTLPGLVRAPASVSDRLRDELPGLGVVLDARFAAVEAIPARALAAYQRAETVLAAADPSCHVTWQLIAAIGKVESNHGRYGGALMTTDGVVHPAITGPRLTGHGQTSRITDTDAGALDGDARYDRAVGPMQFIPSTWTLVGVDADGDGRRDPQDIDDASLATAVYLCSGSDDLATTSGQRSAVHRYNHSKTYVDLVLSIMDGYLRAGSAIVSVLSGPGYLPPVGVPTDGPTAEATPSVEPTFEVVPTKSPTAHPTKEPTGTPTPTPTPTPSVTPTASATPTPSVDPTPSATPSALPTTAKPTSEATSDATPTVEPSSTPTETATATPTVTPTADPTGEPTVTPTATPTDPVDPGDPGVPEALLQAWADCLTSGVVPTDLVAMSACVVQLTGVPADDPDLLALLANPPVTPPTPTQPAPQGRRRRPAV